MYILEADVERALAHGGARTPRNHSSEFVHARTMRQAASSQDVCEPTVRMKADLTIRWRSRCRCPSARLHRASTRLLQNATGTTQSFPQNFANIYDVLRPQVRRGMAGCVFRRAVTSMSIPNSPRIDALHVPVPLLARYVQEKRHFSAYPHVLSPDIWRRCRLQSASEWDGVIAW
jgi:hypothetical protein